MPRPFWKSTATAALLGATLVAFSAASMAEPIDDNDPALREATPAEIQVLQSEQRRDDFQQQQRNFRQQDRATVGAPQPRLDVPIMRPGRQVQPFGNSYMK